MLGLEASATVAPKCVASATVQSYFLGGQINMDVNTSRAVSHLNSGIALRRSPVALAIGFVIVTSRSFSAAAAESATIELEEVTVTGTRIEQSVGMTTPTPVAALAADDLLAMSPGNITEAMTQLPQFYNSATAANFGGAGNGFFTSPGGGNA